MAIQQRPTHSSWSDTHVPHFSPLQSSAECDVCVIGAGITGLSTAYFLMRRGLSVIVLDNGEIASGETERTTAHLTSVLDTRYYDIERMHGTDAARLVRRSHQNAVDTIEAIIREEKIDCDFKRVNGYLFDREETNLNRELECLSRINTGDQVIFGKLPVHNGKDTPCLIFSDQAQFHIMKYLRALAISVVAMGGRIYNRTHVKEIKDGHPAHVIVSDDVQVRAKNIVVATNSPVTDLIHVHTKQAAYRTYVIGSEISRDSLMEGLYWDTSDPYHYVRIMDRGSELNPILLIGGDDHRTGQDEIDVDHFARLAAWASEWFPMFGEIEYRWSGQVYEPVDGLAYIGSDPAHGDNVYLATGEAGVGMTYGTIAALMFADAIQGIDNPWSEIYKPTRKPGTSVSAYVKENLNTASQYMKLFKTDYPHKEDIPLDQGGVVSVDGKLAAIYRDVEGAMHEFDAICPHLKARLCWNECEKSWDCPAHGSRFSAEGKVLDGPANCDLTPLKHKE